MRLRKRLGIVVVITGVLVLLCPRGQRETQAHVPSRLVTGPARTPYVGVPSCSARSCHGADNPAVAGSFLRNEYTTWIERDPHAIAYSVLFGPRATQIMKNLAGNPEAPVAAPDDPRCIACHCEPHIAAQADMASQRVDGVGCEACHGPARRWIDAHTASNWRNLETGEKQQFSMENVKDPETVARTCVGCHVGAPGEASGRTPLRDVNHDMLAAGHPRLDFEFSTFMANLPAHWKQTGSVKEMQRRRSAKSWAVGQFAAARAALTLLADRISRENEDVAPRPWPEFAEYDCSSCHHALTLPSNRKREVLKSRPRFQPTWGGWFMSMPATLLADGAGEIKEFKVLKAHLEQPKPALAETSKLVNAALIALVRLEQHANSQSDRELVTTSLERLRQFVKPSDPFCWELGEQFGLSAAHLKRATSAANNPAHGSDEFLRQQRQVEMIFNGLASPPGMDGTSDFHWDDSFERNLRAIVSPAPQP